MRRGESIAIVLTAVIGLFALGAAAHAAGWVGKPVSDFLRSLQKTDFSVIYSSQLVPENLRVGLEPTAAAPADAAMQVLAPLGLTLRPIGPGLYAVVLEKTQEGDPSAHEANGSPTRAATTLEQIVVAASRYRIISAKGRAERLGRSQLDSQPRFANDAMRVVSRLPGVAGNGLTARFNIRGGDADEVLVLMDGFPIRQPFHVPALQSPFSLFDATVVSRADVYTGGFPLRYGGRMSGVIDIESIDPDQSPRHSLSFSSFDVGARTAGALSAERRLDGLLNLRAGTLKPLLDRLATDIRTPLYTDGMAKLRWSPSDATRVSAQLMWSRDALAVRDVERDELARLSSRAAYAWLQLEHRLNERWLSETWLGNTKLTSHRDGQVDNPEIVRGFVNDERTSTHWDLRWRMLGVLDERQLLEMGAQWQWGDANYRYRSAAAFSPNIAAIYSRDLSVQRDLTLTPFRRDAAAFASYRLRIATDFTVEAGARVQRAAGLGIDARILWDPRLMLSWNLGANTQLRASWGRFHQADEAQELPVEDGAVGFSIPQRSDHAIVGVEHVDSAGVHWRAEVFRKLQREPRPRYENQLNPLAILAELAPDRWLIAADRAELRGLELSAAQQLDNWAWRLAYSWSGAVDDMDGVDFVRSWDQTHAVNATLDWRRGRWDAAVAVAAHTGWPTTRVSTNDTGNTVLGRRNAARLATFASVDVRGRYRLPLPRGELQFAIDVSNLLDRRNRCCSELLAPGSNGSSTITAETLSLLPLTTTFSVRWDF